MEHNHALPKPQAMYPISSAPELSRPPAALPPAPAMLPSSYANAAPPPTTTRLPGVSATLSGAGGLSFTGRGNGLEYAQMRKEKAREEYKERRRLELLATGDIERTKRRKKNDTSMTENQKYHRRLKMNQDSAAAARHAQEVYISTLENLVEVTESEKSVLSIQALNLKSERDELMRRVQQLQDQLSSAQTSSRGSSGGTNNSAGANARDAATDKVAAQAQLDLKTVFELMDAQTPAAPPEFRNVNAVQPARAV